MSVVIDKAVDTYSYANQAISALKLMFDAILNKNILIENLPRPKKEKKLPNVLSFHEVVRVLNILKNEKHKTILFLIYSAGL